MIVPSEYTSKERDAETGLDYFGARFFSSAQGRFTSADQPFNDQNPSDPQSWNLFSYVRNNPLRFTDPSGEDCVYTTSIGSQGTVGVERGTSCSRDGGTFVDGTVDTKSLVYNQRAGTLSYSYTNGDTIGSGVIGGIPAPSEFPGIDGEANRAGAAHIGASQMLINEFAKQSAINAVSGVAGRLIGAGIEAALAGRAAAAATAPIAELTEHGALRLAQRGISREMVSEALTTARETGAIKSNIGQYGTIQHVYQGSNGISVVVETEGRNADKVITAFRTGSKP